MKKTILKGIIISAFVVALTLTFTLTSVSADEIYNEVSDGFGSAEALVDDSYTIEEMLTYALQDEYMAQAEYQAIIDVYGEVRPFTNIILAEGTHISLLLPLFETYGVTVFENTASDNIIIPDSITSALATGIQAEEMNIAMYEKFLSTSDLPDDLREVFTYLRDASINHLEAFSKDRYLGLGTDMMNQFKKAFQKSDRTKTQTYYQSNPECPNL